MKDFGSSLNNKKLSFIFIGDGEQKKNIIKYSNTLKLKNVYFEDPVPGKLVPDYLVHADICLTNLMKLESFKRVRPNKLFQYMALGKPIISGIWGEFQSIIEEALAGIYVDFNNEYEASTKIIELFSDNNLLEIMGRNGKEYVRKYGDREKIFREFITKLKNK
jgi:glycosyltransferase involved in cell wall biosynthesis